MLSLDASWLIDPLERCGVGVGLDLGSTGKLLEKLYLSWIKELVCGVCRAMGFFLAIIVIFHISHWPRNV